MELDDSEASVRSRPGERIGTHVRLDKESWILEHRVEQVERLF